jgi:hypothetical protein
MTQELLSQPENLSHPERAILIWKNAKDKPFSDFWRRINWKNSASQITSCKPKFFGG